MILLTIQETLTTDFFQRAADQLLTIGLLFIVSFVLWKRLNHVEDKLSKYLDEDRKEMIKVISDNSEAMKDLKEAIRNR